MSFLKLSLKENGSSTIFTLSDTVFGEVSENTKKELTSGWKLLYEEGSLTNYMKFSTLTNGMSIYLGKRSPINDLHFPIGTTMR